jgi:hypothetical protein
MVDDKIEIPIEVKLSDSKEIDEKLKQIKEGQSGIKALPKKGKSTSGSSQAVPTSTDDFGVGALFGGETSNLPKNKKADPLGLKKGRSRGKVVFERDLQKMFTDKTSTLEKIFDLGTGNKSPTGAIVSFAGKAAPPIAAALIAIGFIQKIIDVIFGPGGPFDTRLNEFEERARALFDTRDEALKRQGAKVVRISAYYGSRGGKDTTFSTLEPLSRGQFVFDRDLHLISKGTV